MLVYIRWIYNGIEKMTVNKKLAFIYFLALSLEFLILFFVVKHFGWHLVPYLEGVDTTDYLAIAKNLAVNGVYSKSAVVPFIPNFLRLPGYPFWLAFVYSIFKSFTPAIFLGMVVFALSAPLTYLIMKEVFSEKLAFWSGIIFALEPRMAFSAPFILSEQIFLPLFLLAVFFAVKFFNNSQKKNYILLSALFTGFLALFKSIALYLWPLFVFLFYLRVRKNYLPKEAIKIIGLSVLILIFVIAPWLIRNKIVLDTWQLSLTGGTVIYWGHLEILERYLGTPSGLAYQKLIDKANRLAGSNWETAKAAKILTREAFTAIKNHPKEYFRVYTSNLPLFFITDGYKGIISYTTNMSQNYTNFSDLLLRLKFREFFEGLKDFSIFNIILPIVGRSVWLGFTILSFFGIYLGIKNMTEKRLLLIFFTFIILYFALLTGPIGFDPRYRMPVNAFLIAFALVGVFHFLKIDSKTTQT